MLPHYSPHCLIRLVCVRELYFDAPQQVQSPLHAREMRYCMFDSVNSVAFLARANAYEKTYRIDTVCCLCFLVINLAVCKDGWIIVSGSPVGVAIPVNYDFLRVVWCSRGGSGDLPDFVLMRKPITSEAQTKKSIALAR